MGIELSKDELLEQTGFSKPQEGEAVVGGEAYAATRWQTQAAMNPAIAEFRKKIDKK